MIILTVDYEVLGNGLGCDLAPYILQPARRMIEITDKFHTPLTFFVEVNEFIEMEKVQQRYISDVKGQIVQAVKSGHDAQLHLHPQWQGACYTSDNLWKIVYPELWRIGDLDPGMIGELFDTGIAWLKNLLHSVREYRCIAFRAGGWCIQPSETVVNAMRKSNILIDSSVAPGMRNTIQLEWTDFRNTPDLPFWHTNGDVCKESSKGILELPIASSRIGPLRHLQIFRMNKRSGNSGLAPGCNGSYALPISGYQNLKGKFGKFCQLGRVMLDFSTMPADVLIEITSNWMARYGAEVPVVAIAHTKNFTPASEKALEAYLEWASAEGISFGTYGQWLEKMHG